MGLRDETMIPTLETYTETILQFLQRIRGSWHVTFKEGTWAAWLHGRIQNRSTDRCLMHIQS